MKFNLTIKDNETGEILRNIDTNAILAGVCDNGQPQAILLADCEGKELATATVAVERALTKVWGENPEVQGLAMLMNVVDEEEIDLTGGRGEREEE